MSTAREDILERIRKATADVTDKNPETDVPLGWAYGRPAVTFDDTVAEFVQKVIDYKARVIRTTADQVPAEIVAALAEVGAETSVVVPVSLPSTWVEAVRGAGLEVHLDDPTTEGTMLSHVELNGVDAVVTAAASGIADTGTIVLDHRGDQGRRALTLVPDRHICVVRASQIVDDVPQSVQALRSSVVDGQPLTFISGGSATSDIELSRVEGVHGPRRLCVIVVDDK